MEDRSQGSFAGSNVLVTGASRGIGAAVARQFAAAGARLALHYHRNLEAARAVEAALPGGPHLLLQADLAQPGEVETMVREVIDELGRIHVLVNNAGIFEEHPLDATAYDRWQNAWQRTLATNLVGPANLCWCIGRHMIAAGGGRIVNVTSRGAFRGEPDAPAYGASKAGLNALSQSLAKHLAPHGVFVTAVAPGWVDTDMAASTLAGPGAEAVLAQSPLHRVAHPEEIARTVLFLASEGTDYLTGCIVDANGASYLRT